MAVGVVPVVTRKKDGKQQRSNLEVDNSFKKIIIGEESPVIRDKSGITTISVYDFLLKDNSLEL